MKTFFKNGFVFILVAAFSLRLALVGFGTLNSDFNTFVAWSVNLAENGFRNFYQGWSDYLPGYLYLLWFLGKIRGSLPDVILYKLPAILADLGTGYLIYKIVEGLKGKRWGRIAAGIYLFNPAVWANSALWGQIDSLTALFSLLAVFLFDKNYYLSATALALGTAIKPQAAFASAVILFLMKKKRWKIRQILTYGLFSLAMFLIFFLPFSQGNFFQFVLERLKTSFNQYPYTSVNAFNFWGIFGFWRNDSLITQITGLLTAFIFSLAAGMKLLRKPKTRYLFLSVVSASTFLFLTRIHERHLLPVFAPLTIAGVIEPVFFWPLIGFSATSLLNLYYSFNWVVDDFVAVFPPTLTGLFSILSLFSLAFLIIGIFKKNAARNLLVSMYRYIETGLEGKGATGSFTRVSFRPQAVKILLAIVLLFSLITRVVKLSTPNEMYFDEVYHAFTAKLVLDNDPKAWEWWNAHPEGFAYEWTHPPLAKLTMAAGMKVFGENSFGWRIPGALIGVGILYLVYRLGKELFRDELVGVLSAAVFALDGLPLTMSRIGMNDIYFLFFALLAIYLFLKERDFLSAVSFGLALASKWSAVLAIPILFILWLKRKKKFKLSLLWFLLLPFAVYLLTYTPMFLTGHTIGTFWGMQKQMWWYHTGLDATHAYQSAWWSWPLMIRPVYLYTSDVGLGEAAFDAVSRIYAMGNPLVFWFGLVCVLYLFGKAVLVRISRISTFHKIKISKGVKLFHLEGGSVSTPRDLGLILFSYFVFFVPWAVSPRIMFLYHYLPSLPFLAIATAYVLRRFPKTIAYFLVPSALLFIYFYPHWAGLQIPLWLDASYYWFGSWR